MCLNVNGVFAEKLECENGVRQCIEMYDFIFISETWTNECSTVDIDGFKSFCKNRKRRKNAKRDSGGLVVYVREKFANGIHEEDWDYEDGMCFRLNKSFLDGRKMCLQCVYI